jgi:hypothetical protein
MLHDSVLPEFGLEVRDRLLFLWNCQRENVRREGLWMCELEKGKANEDGGKEK